MHPFQKGNSYLLCMSLLQISLKALMCYKPGKKKTNKLNTESNCEINHILKTSLQYIKLNSIYTI